MASVVNHVGLCVTDVARSRRFYEELLGFEFQREMKLPDGAVDRLLGIERPIGLTAVYLQRDGLVLELLHFDRPGNPSLRERPMNEPGLTHLSLCVDDLPDVCARLSEYDAAEVEGTNLGVVVMIRDPDGQLIELLTMDYRKSIEGGS